MIIVILCTLIPNKTKRVVNVAYPLAPNQFGHNFSPKLYLSKHNLAVYEDLRPTFQIVLSNDKTLNKICE